MLNYDEDPTYRQQVRQRVQQRMQPGAAVDPGSPTAPPINSTPNAGYTNPSAPQPFRPQQVAPNGDVTVNGTTLSVPPGYQRDPQTGLITLKPGASPLPMPAANAPISAGSGFSNPTNSAYQSGNLQGVFNQIFPGESLSPQDLAAHEADLNRYGIKVNRNAMGLATDITLPDGTIVDPIQGAGSGLNRKQWLVQGGGGGQGPAPSPTGTSNPFLDSIRSMLMTRLQADQQPVDENSPQIAQPFNAAALQSQRGQEANQRALKERLYAQGDLNSGAFTQQSQQGAEQAATGLAGIKSQLIQQAYQSKVADLNEAMQQALASGDAQMAREIQMQLAALQAQIQREGLGVSLAEFGQNQNALTAHAGLNG